MNKWKITAAVLAVLLTYDEIVLLRNKKIDKRKTKALVASEETVMYLASVMDAHNLELTEFDQLALSTIRT